MKPVQVPGEAHLLEFLFKVFPEQKKTKIKQMLKFGSVLVNGKIVTLHRHPLHAGDRLDFLSVQDASVEKMKKQLPFKVVYEDESVIVVDKPSGLLTMGTETEKENTLYYELTDYIRNKSRTGRGRVFIVHRLDKDASGLLVFARSEEVKEALQEDWNKAVKKYLAVVEGIPVKKEDTIKSFLEEDQFRRVYSTSGRSKNSKESVTHYKVIGRGQSHALLLVTLGTGRKNQIRVHLSDIGHPIAGDGKYGAYSDPLRRLALHAAELSFVHPGSGEVVCFRSAIPPEFKELVDIPAHIE